MSSNNAVSEIETKPSFAADLTGARRVGSDEFFYDIFGVNLKGLKSIWTLVRNPREYFEAAQLPDWGGDHWPSIRIWMGLMGILAAFQFIWASESSEMTAMFQTLAMSLAQGIENGAARDGVTLDMSALDRKELGRRSFKLWSLIYPFFFVAAMCLLALIFRPWKPAASFVIRLRFIFGIIVPGSVFGLISTFAMTTVSGAIYQILSIVSLGVMLGIYWITAFRGPYSHWDRGERIGLSFVTALMILVFILIAQFLSMLISVVPVGFDIVEVLKPQIDAAKGK